ncbi:hypothetical protein IPZ60_01070 [Psychrobacter sp. NG25]|uniref:hypothetical protein n=1 Tax=Psychrobacter sp. NG25 TaxID=2782005 RepID=UPI0018841A99|nr:hypothetical protein [Psychrobacter sp. NG25]MBF0657326.1 hypothetical protein [Psychrobacter sp. NG25]
MFNTKAVWLCNYNNFDVTETYDIDATLPAIFDAVQFYNLEKKKKSGVRTKAEDQEYKRIISEGLEFRTNWYKGEYISEDNMPKKIFIYPEREMPKSDELMFKIINGYLLFSQQCYDIINQFTLGATHFSQVYIYDIETEELKSQTPYYFINIAETRDYLNTEDSKGVKENSYAPKLPTHSIWEPTDDDIQLNTTAQECEVDVWHDSVLRKSLFFSDELVSALVASGTKQQALALIRCVVK